MAETLLLDTSAWRSSKMSWALSRCKLLLDAEAGGFLLHGCFVTLTEVDYITRQERGEIVAEQRIRDLRNLPIQWNHSDDGLCSAAAKLKAAHRISFADAFVAATAIRFDATLVHKDPEFLALAPTLKQLVLAPKS